MAVSPKLVIGAWVGGEYLVYISAQVHLDKDQKQHYLFVENLFIALCVIDVS